MTSIESFIAEEFLELERPEGAAPLAYWREALAGAPELLELPTDRPRPARLDPVRAAVALELDAALAAGLAALGERHGAALSTVLLAGWAATLGRLSGQDDVVAGVAAFGAEAADGGVLDLFAHPLPVRVDLSGSPTVAALLRRVDERVRGARENGDLSVEALAERLGHTPSAAHHPLFQAAFAWHEAAEGRFELPAFASDDSRSGAAAVDVALTLREADGRITGEIEYAAALFDAATVERFASCLVRVLEGMASADEDAPVDAIDVVPGADRRVLDAWNATDRAVPADLRVHDLFRAQAEATPDAVAVSWRGERVTYAELEGRANRLAHALRRRGVGPEARVGVCLPRTPDLLAALLGVLKAGGAYVPLDPAYPRERLGYMMEDAAISLVLTESKLAGRLPEGTDALLLDREREALAAEPDHAPACGAVPENLSHVIFTSGSTGRPKGVMIRHAAVVVLLHWLKEHVTDEERGAALFSTSVNFDVSVAEIFGTLCWGGTLVLVENALELAAVAEPVVHASMVPSAAAELLRSGGIPAGVKTMNLAGEALPAALARELYALGTVEKVGNLYGPTEDTTYSTYSLVRPGAAQVMVGRPVWSTRAYVLDAALRPVPVSVAGELYLAGDGLARGYASRPGLTAERFLPCPFGPAGSRMYRVMDRVRWRADGELEYLGRTDFQVKVRGFRIEPGEIEARLAEHPQVRETVVLVREDAPGDRRLVAYYLGGAAEVEALRAHLSERLPEYMVPAAYVRLEAWPQTPNGKTDRRALPAPGSSAYVTAAYEAPVGETERALAAIWADVLGTDRVGRRDDFFGLGGHSLLAVQVVSRVREALGAEVTQGELFERPVLADFARGLEEAARAELPPIGPAGREAPLALSFAQQRLWVVEQLGATGSAYHIPERLRLRGELDRAALVRALDRIVARHEALRTAFPSPGGEPVQRVTPAGESAFRLVEHDLRGHADAEGELGRIAIEELRSPFDLARGPLIRGRLVRLAADDHALLVTMHHVVSDGWSMGVFTRELSALYAAFRQGRPDPLPPLPAQYADYAAWHRAWVAGEVLERQAAYWERALAGAPELLELPTDRPRPARQDHAGASLPVVFDESLTARLKALSQRHGATLFMAVVAGWATVLSRLSGQGEVVIGSPTANRGVREIEGLIGFFTNTVALRVDLSGAPSVAELLARVKARALEAQANQDIPFEQVLDRVRPARTLAYNPLFQAMVAWQNAPRGDFELPGLAVSPVPAPAHETSKLDLLLDLREADGQIIGTVEYATALFDRATVERHVGYLMRVLEEMAEGGARAVDRLDLLSAAERRRVLEDWNRTEAAYPADSCIHQLFEAQVRRTPDAVASIDEAGSLTYAELNARANRIARRLRALGVGPESRVGVCVARTAAMPAALLGVLKAGAAYVPLDPAYPAERLAFTLRDADVAALVTEEALRSIVPVSNGVPVVSLDRDAAEIGRESAEDLPNGATPRSLAYLIYTSGSTGVPKGVAIEHESAVALLSWAAGVYTAEELSGVLASTSICFDLSVFELFLPLSRGGRVIVVENALALARSARAGEVRLVNTVPSAAAALLKHGGIPAGVRTVNLAGEPLKAELVDALYARAGVERVYDLYGPSEDTTYSTWTLRAAGGSTTIGRPILNTRAYVLDAALQPVPAGVAGELYLAGRGLARGYLGRAGLTAERFVPDAFGPEAGGRMYRTGDRVRWRADGTLEYLGRLDGQVKVRGFRIEPGEIEARLAEHPEVREAVVAVREDVPGEKRLVAYVVGDEAATTEALRAHLSARLPDYMVPAAYVRLAAIPLTPNGKVDRKALSAPEAGAFGSRGYEAPSGDVELALAEIWAELLGVERIGRRDHFFALGGHSLLAVQVVSRVREALEVEAAPGDLFERPVLADFAHGLARAGRAALSVIEPVDRTRPLALSFAQARLWFLEQLGGAGSAYHVADGLRLTGHLDRAALLRALDRIVARHEALRTTFATVDGEPVQRVAPAEESAFRLVDHDLRGRADAEGELRRIMAEEAEAPFDLARGPLIRGRLARLAEEEHVLLLTMHHVVSDGWSMGVFLRELGVLYDAFHRGAHDPLPALPVQYADYAAWHRRWVAGEVLERQSAYWLETLSGAPDLLELPADRPRPARQSHAGASVPLALDERATAALKALSQRHGTTLYMTLLAGWATVLSRLSGQDDVVVGSPAANRGRSEIEGLIGFFVNTLALRVDLSDSPTVARLLARVKERALGAQAHQDIPFEQVVERLQPVRSLSHSAVFQVLFAWQNAPGAALALPGLRVEGVDAEHATSKFDLSLSLYEDGGRIAGSLTYATALFDRSTAERYAGYLARVLEQMAEDDGRSIEGLVLLDDDERRHVVEGWNSTAADHPADVCLHEMFEAQAERTPDAVALVHEDESLTYAALNARANRLAHHLRSLGVGPDVRVGLCVERSVEMMVGLLAVLKAGGAYVPLDPDHPADRLRYTLADSAPAVLLTQTWLLDRCGESDVPVVTLDGDASAAWAHQPETNPERAGLGRDHLAYIIYTSGSTGRPKGVMVAHRSVVNVVRWMSAAWPLDGRDAVLQKTPYSFDASLRELALPLVAGARLVMARPGGHKDPAYLVDAVKRYGITTLHFVPSMLQVLAQHPGLAECATIARVVCGGEPLPRELARRFNALLPNARLFNVYGPTEAAVDVTAWACEAGEGEGTLPIGRPMANVRVYVLDRAGNPVPAGVVGELYLGGVQVARGYRSRADLTAERFVPDAFGGDAGARLYRTGDLGRWLADGSIEFLGRNDHQVKVRGYRIELGEIEARLLDHPRVREAVVMAREDAAGDRRLVAYVAGADVEVDALRAHLSERLPEYMVPAAYVRLEALPLLSNGKLDRKALPAPEAAAYSARAFEAPSGGVEQAVAEVWAEVLGTERVGRRDHFFELGGHSLLAVRVVSRIREALGVEAALGDLFVRPVLADFARGLEAAARAELPPIVSVDRAGLLAPSFAQARLWFLEELGGAGASYHVPTRLRLNGALDRGALARALDRVVARHEALRTTFHAVDGEPAQRIAPAAESRFALRLHDLSGRADGEQELLRLMAEEAAAPFDLETGPLVRGRLVRLAADDHALLVTMHHVVSDAWSAAVFTRELGALYAAYSRGEGDPLAPLPVQYADYAAWQRRWVGGDVLQRQAAYWTGMLGGAPELLELPADRPRPARQDHAGAAVTLELDEALTAALKELSRRHGATLFMTLMAGWATVLSRLSGQDDVVIGTPTANRGRTEIEGLVGFFVNTLALRVDLSASPTVADVVAQVRERSLAAQAHQDIPFEQVVERLQPARSLAHSPVFQVLFAWQNAPGGALELPGLTVRAAEGPEHDTAKFDLTLWLHENEGRIAGGLTYATALFDRETAERYLGYLRRVLEAMAADERRPVSRIDLLPAAERAQAVDGWNRTEADYPAHLCVHQLFEAQVRRTPDATALVFEGGTISYAELNRRANRLAHYLAERGVGPDARVGLCLERGPEMVVALLAVLKAGGAYVPLDPEYPEERLRWMLEDSAPAVLLTESALAARFAASASAVISIDADADAWADRSEIDLEIEGLTSEHLAYVIYTSGSTGRPKGVMNQHRTLVNRLAWGRRAWEVGEGDAVMLKTSLNFDGSVREVFLPLMAGARIVVARPQGHRDPAYLLETIEAEGITFVNLVPSMLQVLLEAPDVDPRCRGLKRILCGGEALPGGVLKRFRERLPAVELHNLYGPSEAATAVSAPCGAGDEARGSVPIGHPAANVRAYVLDEAGQPAPVGVAGELYVGGAGVARGYQNRAGLTAERFVPDPFGATPGARLYRTGDVVRRLADGRLEFVGRDDDQVKVRGFRVELGEVEARLLAHAAVREAVVAAREDGAGGRALVAYIVGGELEIDALRAHLAERLPDYMVPSAFVRLERLPLTPNGKVDRRALPAPGGDAYLRRAFESPVTAAEAALAEIWSAVLRVERVGRWDHFFELGGHSLLAVQVVSRVRRALGVEVPLGRVFERPVLADFARGLETADRNLLPAVEPASPAERRALSFAQQRLWFLEELGGVGSTYHVRQRIRLTGILDRDALGRALSRVVARHEALRTTFAVVDGEPEQRIAPADEAAFVLVDHDLRRIDAGDGELRRIMAEEADAPFDLERGPLFRGRLVRTADDEHVLLLTMHHVVSDGWSVGVLLHELGALYGAFSRGEGDPLAPLPVQYADYAAWQRRWVSGEALESQAAYWTRALAGAPELLELPTDHPRPARQDHAGAWLSLDFDADLTAALKALSQRQGATLFMTLLAGWSAVLSRLSSQDDVVVGTPTANRGRGEIEGLIGFFVNTLALRIDLAGSPTVAELLARVKARALEAQAHQDIPFEQVVERVRPARSLAHSPVFQSVLTWQNTPRGAPRLPGLTLSEVEGESRGTAKFDLSLTLLETDGRIAGRAEYATSLFEQATVERFLGYLRRVLAGMAADESRAVDALPILSDDERTRVIETWNATAADFPREACVHELFEAQVAKSPDAEALTFEGERLTYAQLNARANRLAHHLRTLGAKPDARVAICAERGTEMVVAILAVMKSGAAYVPLDPAYPADRLRYMLEDSAPAVLLADSANRHRFADVGVPVVGLDDGAAWAGMPETNPERDGLTSDHLAYVIYTSGSTGQPKGVMNRHAAVTNLLAWSRRAWALEAGDAVLQRMSFSFDVSVREVFAPLTSGARLVVARPGGHLDPDYLVESIRREQVTTIVLSRSMLQLLVEHPALGACGSLKRVVSGGEALTPALVDGFYARLPQARLQHEYGPTETTVTATVRACAAGDGAPGASIGLPVSNARVYLLDRAGQPVPVGVAGEVYVGGAGVARGYLNRPALTAERFVADPFAAEPGARMYRTGDLARRLADGTLEFLGRNDFQVKVRGFRIEPGEVEARLADHAEVRRAVVDVRDDAAGERRLVAYVVPASVDGASAEAVQARLAGELKGFLRERLPEYMVPAAYVVLDALPLTPSGKVDRRALPDPEAASFAAEAYEAPVGEIEETVAEIWAGVLGVERVGRRDSFFELGGHSLLAVQVVSRVRQTLAADVAVGEVFERPVLRDFARGLAAAARAELPAIEPADRSVDLPLSFAQQRLWFLEEMGGVGATYHIPARLRLRGDLDRDALRRALERIVARHEVLRTTFGFVDGSPVQRIASDVGFDLPEHDLRSDSDADEALRALMTEEAKAPFDLAAGPLFRGRLVRFAEDDHVLLLTMHHIVSDGWSMGVLFRELSALYAAFLRGEGDPLPALPVQYADYAAWQRKWIEGEVLEAQGAYWSRALSGAPDLLTLPTDRARPARHDYAGGGVRVELDAALTASLKDLSRRHGTTMFMTLLAGWATVMSRLSGQKDVVVGTPSANRGRPEIEGLVGFFVNALPLRVELTGAPSVGELLARVKERALSAQAHQDIPFEQVVERVKPARSMAHHPLFQVMFGWQSAGGDAFALPGLEVGSVDAGAHGASKFDLSLSLREDEGRIVGTLTYATALFDAATAQRFTGYLSRVLEQMAADDTQSVDALVLLPEAERRRVLEEWNETAAAYPRDVCMHQLVEAQAARTPDAVAVTFEGAALTYGELNARANRLAHHLRALGVKPDARVGLCVERSLEMVVGLLAVHKAGGAYVPLDPAYPLDRLRFMVEDSAPAVVLTQEKLRGSHEAVFEGLTAPVVSLDADVPAWAGESDADPVDVGVAPENIAYVIYTSGSTGRPKGVLLEHRAMVNRLHWMQETFKLGADDAMLQNTSFSFDASVWEFFLPWMTGGRVVVVRPEELRDPADVIATVKREQITSVLFIGSMLQLFLEAPGLEELTRLKRVFTGGEAMPPVAVRHVHERLPWACLYNFYGPSEAAVAVRYRTRSEDAARLQIPIGRPVENMRVYVLDGRGNPVPAGVAGEIYVGGAQMARGYLDRPGMTADRFGPDPFCGEPGARMYRTGDMGRWTADGKLDFLGRNDFQVKVRGHRVELGEIEARLMEHPDVREAVVLAREDVPGDQRLVAYVVGSREGVEVEVEALRSYLSDLLPAYMVPAAYVRLEKMPVTPSGKTDRLSLPAPEGDAYLRRVYEAPLGEVETKLAEIWADVLGIEEVGRHDNFFELGGHSLLVVKLVDRMRRAGLHADIRALFSTTTLAELAAEVGAESGDVEVPANGIPTPCDAIRPEMLPLVDLDQASIDRLVRQVPGGAANVQDIYPLAPLQEGILFHHLMTAEGDPYLTPIMYAFPTRAELDAFLGAFQKVIDRHDIWRTAVLWEGVPEPVQVVLRNARIPVDEVDLDPSEGDAAEVLHERFNPRRHRIDVRQAPLMRAAVAFDPVENRWLLLVRRHHLASDHTSSDVLRREIQAHLAGREDQLPAPLPFRNFVAQTRLGVSQADHEAFFRGMLGDVHEPTAPFGMLDVQGDGSEIVQAKLRVDSTLAERLRARSRALRVSTASLCHVAWAQVLARVSIRDDVVFGTVLFGRMQGGEGSTRVMGPFINTLPVRVNVGSEGVEATVRRTHAVLGDLLRHEHASLALAQRCSGVQAPAPLFSAMINYRHRAEIDTTRVADAAHEEASTPIRGEERTNYPLTLSVDDLGDEGFRLTIKVRESVDPARVCALVHTALDSLATALETSPDAPINTLDVLSPSERARVLTEWNATSTEYPRDLCIHDFVEAQVARTPDAVAVTFEGESLTYREVNARANRLAHHLRALGVKPDARVGLCVERSLEMVVGLLAVMKAGGAYVPMDPAYPLDRLRYMLEDSAPAVVLTQARLGDTLDGLFDGIASPVLYLDSADPAWANEPATDPERGGLSPESLAYVIYTSGSTGRPKGVALEHRAMVNRLHWMQEVFQLGAGDAMLQNTSFSFDASVWEFFLPMMNGARVVMVRQGTHRDPGDIVGTIRRERITILFFVASMLQFFLEAPGVEECATVRHVLSGGEALPPVGVRKFYDRLPNARLHNIYGPSEGAVAFRLGTTREDADLPQVPIGKPVANTRVYLLDERGAPVPIGVPGEIHVGGLQVARGYLDRPGLTADRFGPDPFSGEPGARIYRSGDVGRWTEDGRMEFLGRNDFQVKVRGHRVELGEIEARLAEHPDVREAVVLAREDVPGDQRLVAYFVSTRDGAEVEVEALRAHLSEVLPAYMVPAAYVRLEAMPLTPSRKVDRKALPAPEDGAYARRAYEAPVGEVEERLAGIWAEVLGVERVGRHDNFFELGGHSLLVVRLVGRMQGEGLSAEVRALFTAPTLAELANETELFDEIRL